MSGEDWTQEEVATIVADYRHMLIQELGGQSYNKAAHNRLVQEQTGRSRGSIERKHQNISAILRDAGCYYIPGYKPLSNYQYLLEEEVERQLLRDAEMDQAILVALNKAWQAPVDINFRDFVVAPPQGVRIAEERPAYSHQPIQRDYAAREALNRSLGLAGEKVVLSYERSRLRLAGHERLANRIEHVSKTRGDGAGFDIMSFEEDGRERFIEVKTTGFGMALPFYISKNELDFSSGQPEQYHLYRVFEMQRAPRMFTVQGDMREKLWLDPANYRAGVLGTS